MAKGFQVVFDCADPSGLSAFWVEALGYKWMDPPEGYASWGERLLSVGVPENEWDPGERPYNKIVDPDGRWPTIWTQRATSSAFGERCASRSWKRSSSARWCSRRRSSPSGGSHMRVIPPVYFL